MKKSVGGLAGSKGRCIFALPKRPVRLGVRTPGFHPGSRGSIPLRATYKPTSITVWVFSFLPPVIIHLRLVRVRCKRKKQTISGVNKITQLIPKALRVVARTNSSSRMSSNPWIGCFNPSRNSVFHLGLCGSLKP